MISSEVTSLIIPLIIMIMTYLFLQENLSVNEAIFVSNNKGDNRLLITKVVLPET